MTKKQYRITLLSVALIVIIAITLVLYNTQNDKAQKSFVANYKYIVKEYSGQIAVYKPEEKTPIKTYNVFIENLPSSDQEDLKTGINIKTDEELRNIIEDFTG